MCVCVLLLKDALSCKHYVASVIEEWMGMEQFWGDNEEKTEVGGGSRCNILIT